MSIPKSYLEKCWKTPYIQQYQIVLSSQDNIYQLFESRSQFILFINDILNEFQIIEKIKDNASPNLVLVTGTYALLNNHVFKLKNKGLCVYLKKLHH
jgi:hypothetical protein